MEYTVEEFSAQIVHLVENACIPNSRNHTLGNELLKLHSSVSLRWGLDTREATIYLNHDAYKNKNKYVTFRVSCTWPTSEYEAISAICVAELHMKIAKLVCELQNYFDNNKIQNPYYEK